MKKFLLASVAFAAIAGPAMAADMPIKAPPPPPVAYYDWSGAYIGFNAGGVWYDVNREYVQGPAGRNTTTSGSDGIFGFHAGAQWQWGAWVLGGEAALSGCFRECLSESGLNPVPPFGTPNRFQQNKITNLFTAGPRLGYAWDRLLVFGTGGVASASLKSRNCVFNTGVCSSPEANQSAGQSTNWGWYAGGGFDYLVHQGPLVDVVLGVEYQHFDVSSHEALRFEDNNNIDLSAKGDLVRARLTIKTHGYSFFY